MIPPETAVKILRALHRHAPEARVPVIAERDPGKMLWTILDETLLLLRLPLYHRRLRKPAPKRTVIEIACGQALWLLDGFAHVYRTQRAIVSTKDRWPAAISFQPAPHGAFGWTATHSLTPAAQTMESFPPERFQVSIADFMHLAAKVVHAIGGHMPGRCPDLTSTIAFEPEGGEVRIVQRLVARPPNLPRVQRYRVTLTLAYEMAHETAKGAVR